MVNYGERPVRFSEVEPVLVAAQKATGYPPDKIFGDGYLRNVQERQERALQHFVAEHDGCIVGYAMVAECFWSDVDVPDGAVEFGGLVVHPDWQRQKVATNLFRMFVSWWEQQSAPAVFAAWTDGPSHRMFEKYPGVHLLGYGMDGLTAVFQMERATCGTS